MHGGQRTIGKVLVSFKLVGSWEGIQILWVSGFSIYMNIHMHTYIIHLYIHISLYIIYVCMDTYICIYTYSFYTQGEKGGSGCSRACTNYDNPSSMSWTHKVEGINWLPQVVLWIVRGHCTHTETHNTHRHNEIIQQMLKLFSFIVQFLHVLILYM